MRKTREKTDIREATKNAATGYAVVVLSIVCFLLVLVVAAALVRLVVGASAVATVATGAGATM